MPTTVGPTEDRRLLGIAMVLAGYFCFSISDTCAKWMSQGGMPTTEVVFVRYAGQFLLVLAIFLPTERLAIARTRRLSLEVVRALCLLSSTVTNFFAIL